VHERETYSPVPLLPESFASLASSLEGQAFRAVLYEERFDVQKLFVDTARAKLPFAVGAMYTDITVKCLAPGPEASATKGCPRIRIGLNAMHYEEMRRFM
jgi:hypothetical protein